MERGDAVAVEDVDEERRCCRGDDAKKKMMQNLESVPTTAQLEYETADESKRLLRHPSGGPNQFAVPFDFAPAGAREIMCGNVPAVAPQPLVVPD